MSRAAEEALATVDGPVQPVEEPAGGRMEEESAAVVPPVDDEGGEAGTIEVPVSPEDTLRVMALAGVTVDLPSANPEVVLREVAYPWRELRFRIGYAEGIAMAHAWRRIPSARPLTHETWVAVMREMGVTVEAVRIIDVDNGVYFCEMVLAGGSGNFTIPCRPSDAIIIALRQEFSVPIMVAESVLTAGRR